jgi:hypothetical protein
MKTLEEWILPRTAEEYANMAPKGFNWNEVGCYAHGYETARKEIAPLIKVELEWMQCKIDALMLEYCPEDMTEEQIENWKKHQKPVDINFN